MFRYFLLFLSCLIDTHLAIIWLIAVSVHPHYRMRGTTWVPMCALWPIPCDTTLFFLHFMASDVAPFLLLSKFYFLSQQRSFLSQQRSRRSLFLNTSSFKIYQDFYLTIMFLRNRTDVCPLFFFTDSGFPCVVYVQLFFSSCFCSSFLVLLYWL
jgi:hypothetical protein